MNSSASLTGSHRRTYETIFQHPVSHNLGWRSVLTLLGKLGRVEEEPNGNFKVTRNGQLLVLHPPRAKDVAETGQLLALRHFLERSEKSAPATNGHAARWLLVISHHEARIYRSTAPDAVPQLIRPHPPADFFRHAPDSKDFARGQEKPDPNSFFEPVAAVLNGAGAVLVFGGGTGTASEMAQFVAWAKLHRPALAARVVGTEVVDEHHLTEEQLLAQAREFFKDAGRFPA